MNIKCNSCLIELQAAGHCCTELLVPCTLGVQWMPALEIGWAQILMRSGLYSVYRYFNFSGSLLRKDKIAQRDGGHVSLVFSGKCTRDNAVPEQPANNFQQIGQPARLLLPMHTSSPVSTAPLWESVRWRGYGRRKCTRFAGSYSISCA